MNKLGSDVYDMGRRFGAKLCKNMLVISKRTV